MRVSILWACISTVSATISLHHRIFHPDLPALSYIPRATVDLSTGQLTSEQDLPEHFAGFIEALQTVDNPENTLYQLALEHEYDTAEALWDFSSVRACYLAQATSQTIVLHFPSSNKAGPHALDYFLSPINHDGTCPLTNLGSTVSTVAALESFSKSISNLNTTILIRNPTIPPSPELRSPPAISAEGEVVKPPPEKSFIQKYWMYMVAFLLVVREYCRTFQICHLLTMDLYKVVAGPEEEAPKRQPVAPPE
ncbi:hypothetical protein CVT24_003590 [Panaeolus cyanescens]|uniref:ER membrane protein complex subunit 10 n=1 Tax=Panaeolus cyanescens TaxID=181874 RepID=A0A409Y7P1_9AGAR|nr:hypothetical protein CVT24_003590 [Panaeolus cyanescens]